MIAHKLGSVAVFSTSNLILAKFVGLVEVGFYSNYYMVISAANSLPVSFFFDNSKYRQFDRTGK